MSNPSAAYDVQTYLLDRANIHDTITKLPWYYDTRSAAKLAEEVFAPEITIDYGPILGREPFTVAGPAWAEQLAPLLNHFDSTQHLYTGLIIELPQPGVSTPRPDRCKVLGQVAAHMVSRDARGGPLMSNGGQAIFELVRLSDLEAKGQNPWRISSQKVVVTWEKGNMAVMNFVSKNSAEST